MNGAGPAGPSAHPEHCRPLAAGEVPSPDRWLVHGVGGRLWCFRRPWWREHCRRTEALFAQAARFRRGDRCLIVGNGPSLNAVDPARLDGIDLLVSNNILLHEGFRRRARVYAVTNHFVAEQLAGEIHGLRGPVKLFPYWLGHVLAADETTFFLNAVPEARFYPQPWRLVSWVSSVSFFLMQVAFGLGYRRVGMIGFDHRYHQPAGVAEGTPLRSGDGDPNHFDGRYFQGLTWQAADVTRMARAYRLARDAFEAAGGEIVNATAGGDLDVFARVDLEAWLRSPSRHQGENRYRGSQSSP